MRMSKAEQDKYLTKKAVAVFPIANTGGIEILDINEERVVYRFTFSNKIAEAHKSKIIYGKRNRFKTYVGYSVHLDECMKV